MDVSTMHVVTEKAVAGLLGCLREVRGLLHAGCERRKGREGWEGRSWMWNCCVYRQVHCDLGATDVRAWLT